MTDRDYVLTYVEQVERADAAVARVCELLDDVSKKQAEIDRLQKRVDELETKDKHADAVIDSLATYCAPSRTPWAAFIKRQIVTYKSNYEGIS